ncbi:hypothetical protein EMCRGX_G009648 [Ephydatia muelleri]
MAVCKYVYIHFANLIVTQQTGLTPLHLAVMSGNTEVVNVLLTAKVDEKTEKTPLHLTAIRGNAEMVNALLVAGFKVDEKDEMEQTPLYHAALRGNTEVVNALLEAGSKVDEKDKVTTFIRQFNTAFSISRELIMALMIHNSLDQETRICPT